MTNTEHTPTIRQSLDWSHRDSADLRAHVSLAISLYAGEPKTSVWFDPNPRDDRAIISLLASGVNLAVHTDRAALLELIDELGQVAAAWPAGAGG